jgi:phosphoribosyl-ATP pyrophosphohydrolase
MRVIEERKRDMPADSYTAQLLAGGVERIGSKVAEEAAEVVEAAGEPGQEGQAHLVREAADLLYHLFVLLASRSATWPEVEAELAGRFGLSGLAEKANRPPKPRPGG